MRSGKIAFAIGMIASTHGALAYACGALMVLGGVGLMINRTAALSARVLFVFTLTWLALMKVPPLFTGPNSACSG